jgi:nucleolar protein 14
VNFLNFTLVELSGVKVEGIPETRSASQTALCMSPKSMPKTVPAKPSFDSLFTDSVNDAEYKLQVFVAALELIEAASETWKSYVSFPEIFRSTTTILNTVATTKLFTALPSALQTKLQTLLTTLQRRSKLCSGSRVPLALQSHRPIPIPTYLPRFSMSHSFDSKNDPNHARSALNKLKAVHRRERKGVIRELRKEARTEAVVRSEEGRRRDKIYEERMKVAEGIMKGGNDVGKWERDQKRKRK